MAKISAQEQLGWKGLLRVLKDTRWKKDLLFAGVVALVLLFVIVYAWKCEWIPLLKKVCSSLIDIYGGLLGISVAAYALLLGMPHLQNIIGVVRSEQSSSLYAKTHAQFTLYLLLQLFTLLGVFIVSILVEPDGHRLSSGVTWIDAAINFIVLFFILFAFLYQLILAKDSFLIVYNGAIFFEASTKRKGKSDL